MENYICLNCKFKFKANQMPRTCPYCAKGNVQKEQTASDLVGEVEDLLTE